MKKRILNRVSNWAGDAVLWIAVLLVANGLGMLLSAVWDTVTRLRHPTG